MTINGADGKPVGNGSSRFAYLAAPVKDPSGANAQLVIGGLTDDPADAPGPFGVYLPATTHRMQRSTTSSGSGPVIDAQDWVFEAASGEHLEVHLEYEHGVGNKGNPAEGKFYSGKNPAVMQIWRQEQVLDILRNATTNPPDHVRKFSFKGGVFSFEKGVDDGEWCDWWLYDDLVYPFPKLSAAVGFAATACIHPGQVETIRAAYRPDPAELEAARELLAAAETAGGGVFRHDGRMVDGPVLAHARAVLRRS